MATRKYAPWEHDPTTYEAETSERRPFVLCDDDWNEIPLELKVSGDAYGDLYVDWLEITKEDLAKLNSEDQLEIKGIQKTSRLGRGYVSKAIADFFSDYAVEQTESEGFNG
jgi:hypothetical protein